MNATLETTVHEQLLPDTAVDPTWCRYSRQLNELRYCQITSKPKITQHKIKG